MNGILPTINNTNAVDRTAFCSGLRLFFSLTIAALVVAAVSGAALSWDGSWHLFNVLHYQRPFVPNNRFITIPFQWPVLIVSRLTSDFRILQIVYGLPYVAIPLIALATCWWLVRCDAPHLFIWPVLGIGLGTLPGEFFFTSESIIAVQLFWPLLLAILTGIRGLQISGIVLIGIAVFVAHPVAFPLFAFGACVALVVGLLSKPQGRQMWIWTVGLITMSGLRLCLFLVLRSPYEASEVSLNIQLNHFNAAVAGLPLKSLTCAWLAATFAFLSPVLHRFLKPKHISIIHSIEVASLVTAGALLIFWASNPHRWRFALDFRNLAVFASLPFMLIASLESFVGVADSLRNRENEWSHRIQTIQIVSIVFLLVLSIQSTVWYNLRHRLSETITQSSGNCISKSSLRWLNSTPLYHWATPAYSILLQGKKPQKLILDGDFCADPRFSQIIRITPWDLVSRKGGWFDLSLDDVEGARNGKYGVLMQEIVE